MLEKSRVSSIFFLLGLQVTVTWHKHILWDEMLEHCFPTCKRASHPLPLEMEMFGHYSYR